MVKQKAAKMPLQLQNWESKKKKQKKKKEKKKNKKIQNKKIKNKKGPKAGVLIQHLSLSDYSNLAHQNKI